MKYVALTVTKVKTAKGVGRVDGLSKMEPERQERISLESFDFSLFYYEVIKSNTYLNGE